MFHDNATPSTFGDGPSPRVAPLAGERTTRRGLCAVAALLMLGAVVAAGCGRVRASSDGPGVRRSASSTCAMTVTYGGRTYYQTAGPEHVAVAERLGTGTIPPCNDTGRFGDEPVGHRVVHRVVGLDPRDAIAVRDAAGGPPQFLAVHDGTGPPPAVLAFLAEHTTQGSLLVTPDRGLRDGDTVTVTIRGLDPGTEATLGQCSLIGGDAACLARPTGPVPAPAPRSVPPTQPDGTIASTTSAPTSASASTPIVQVTLQVHDPLRGNLELFTTDGDRLNGRTVPRRLRCEAGVTRSCMMAVQGTHEGRRVVRSASIHFAATKSPPPSRAGRGTLP